MFVEPVERRHAQFLRVAVAAGGDDEAEVVFFAVQLVDATDFCEEPVDAVEREDTVVVGVEDEQRARRDERCDLGKIPPVSVHVIHAVAMPLDDSVDNVVLQVGNSGDRRGDLDALVERSDPPTVRAAAAAAGNAEAVFVHDVKRRKVVECADAVPRLHTRRRVATGVPPPHAVAIGAVVDAFEFAELDRVNDEADIAVPGEPGAVMLVVCFVAIIDAVNLHATVPANVEDRRRGGGEILGYVQVAGDVQAGAGLKVKVAHLELVVLHRACDGGLQRRAFRQRIEPEHFVKLLAIEIFFGVPIVECLDFGEAAVGQSLGFDFEILGKHPVAGRLQFSGVAKRHSQAAK